MRNRFIKVWPNAFVTIIAGVIGALLVSGLLATGRWLGVSSLQLEEILGVLVTGSAELTYTWAIGFGWHLLNGAFFAFIYAFCFKKLGRGGISAGAALGAVHWLLASLFLGLLLAARGLWPSHIAAEDVFGGSESFGFFLLAHFLYGAAVGLFFQPLNLQTDLLNPEIETTEPEVAA
jgi:hypothetical protein